MRKLILTILSLIAVITCAQAQDNKGTGAQGSGKYEISKTTDPRAPKVFFTRDISPQGLYRAYEAVGRKATGRVAVKISTGEAGGDYYLHPDLIRALVDSVKGTIVECNTAYGGSRGTTERHLQTIHEHGFDSIAKVDIMDAEGEEKIPVLDQRHIEYDIVGSHLKNYDFLINLAHFKGHAMAGFGGVLKNQSIGIASSRGKMYIHNAGESDTEWTRPRQNDFLESMAAAAQAVADQFGDSIVYIDVMNNLSVDCDCDAHPQKPEMDDIGILASTDPVALDKACLDIIFTHKSKAKDNAIPLQKRIKTQNGLHLIYYAEGIRLGRITYQLIDLDKKKRK